MKRLNRKSFLKFTSRSLLALVVAVSINPVPATASAGQLHERRTKRSSKRPSTSSKAPIAYLEVINHRNGTSSLIFKFSNVPANFQVDKIALEVKKTKPVSPVQGSPAEQVKAAYYTAKVSNDTFDQQKPVVNADIRMYKNPREPYTLAIICLWYSRANSHIEFQVKPKYLDVQGKEISMLTQSQEKVVVLENRPAVSPVDLQSEPSGSSNEPTCNDRNANQGD